MFDTPLCSGFGQFHSDKHPTDPKPFETITLNDILAFLVNPQQVDKATAQWVIPSNLLSRAKDDQLTNGKYYALWQDIDAPNGLTQQSMANTLTEIVNATVWAYTTSSATADNQKCRMVIPLSSPIDAITFNQVQRVINAKLLQKGITPDIANERVNQVFYLPNRGSFYDSVVVGESLGYFDVATLSESLAVLVVQDEKAESDILAAREVSRARAANRVASGASSPIEAFNSEYDIHSLLIGYGYLKKGNRYLSPNSTSGIAGLTVKHGNKYITNHQTDIDAGLRTSGDAFDLYKFYEHGNDNTAALKACGEMFKTIEGRTITKTNQIAFSQKRDEGAINHGKSVAAALIANSESKNIGANSANSANTQSWRGSTEFARFANCANSEIQQDDETDYLKATPRPTPEQLDSMLYGVIGEFALSAASGKGLNPIATAIACMTWLSAEFSPRIVVSIGDIYHPCRIYAVHVGRSARGGKGDSLNLVNRVRMKINETYPDLLGQYHSGGLTSREGVATLVHDGYTDGKDEIAPILDKRVFTVEPEFAQVLAVGKRDGNTLMTAIRDCWDNGGSIKPLTKTSRMWATNPHISILGNVTPFELRAKLTSNEIHGGTLNRLLMIFAERIEAIAIPERTPLETVDRFAQLFADLISWAKGDYGTHIYGGYSDNLVIPLSDDARTLWLAEFNGLSSPFGSEVVSAATDRRHAYALRLALLFCITDRSHIITLEHLKAGIAWAKFSAITAQYVLSAGADDTPETDPSITAKLMDFLTANKGIATRSQITKDCFKRHLSGRSLDMVLQPLLDNGALTRELKEPKAGGTKVAFYSLAKKSTVRTVRKACEQLPRPLEQDCSHSSQSSHQCFENHSSQLMNIDAGIGRNAVHEEVF